MRTIPAAVVLLLAVNLCCQYLAKAESTMDSVERVMKSCRDKYQIQTSYLETAIKNKKLPQDGKGKAFLLCVIRDVGFNKLKNIIRGGSQLNGEVAKLVALPDVERELLESSFEFGIL